MLVAATAGTARHSLVLDHALRPLFFYLHAVVVPTATRPAALHSVENQAEELADHVPFEELLGRA